MTRPANVKMKVARKGGPVGRPIPPGSSFVKVDWDKAEEVLTGQHAPDDYLLGHATQIASQAIVEAEREGKEARARRIRRDLNSFENARMAVRASWCPTCVNFLHNCQCQVEDIDRGADPDFIASITAKLGQTHKMKRMEKKARKAQAG